MTYMLNYPRFLSLVCAFAMWGLAWFGAWLRARFETKASEVKENLGIVVSATLTLLGLIIGFTFSMATSRYDQRRLFEEQEANAIGTEYVRATLLPEAEGLETRKLLKVYLNERIQFYQTEYGTRLGKVDEETALMQAKLWRSIEPQAVAQPNPVTALIVSGMNDVLNSQGYTQFAWWNRIPGSAWTLMIAIALFSNGLVGYATQRSRFANLLLLALPLIVSISFFLIADIDSPREGMIRIPPRDLQSLSKSLGTMP
ncbi:MAG: hypothetical protein ACRYFU_04430 [Janthinobacterium lividum]